MSWPHQEVATFSHRREFPQDLSFVWAGIGGLKSIRGSSGPRWLPQSLSFPFCKIIWPWPHSLEKVELVLQGGPGGESGSFPDVTK